MHTRAREKAGREGARGKEEGRERVGGEWEGMEMKGRGRRKEE